MMALYYLIKHDYLYIFENIDKKVLRCIAFGTVFILLLYYFILLLYIILFHFYIIVRNALFNF